MVISCIEMRYREVKKYGNSWVILLLKGDILDLKLDLGDKIDLESGKIKKNENIQN